LADGVCGGADKMSEAARLFGDDLEATKAQSVNSGMRDRQLWMDEVQKITKDFVGRDHDLGLLMLDMANNYWDKCFDDGLTPQEGLAALIKHCEARYGSIQQMVAAFKQSQDDIKAYQNARRLLDEQERTSWFVYCIHDQQSHRTKIGTSRNPDARLKQHQTGCPTKLELVGFFAGGRSAETAFLRCFYLRRITINERMTEWMEDEDHQIVENFREISEGWSFGNYVVIERGQVRRRKS
jgi:hypothetical protein